MPTKARPVLKGTEEPADAAISAAREPLDIFKVKYLGETWSVPRDTFLDYDLIDDLANLQAEGDPTRLPRVLRRLLGTDQHEKAISMLRASGGGRVSIEDAAVFLAGLMEALNPN